MNEFKYYGSTLAESIATCWRTGGRKSANITTTGARWYGEMPLKHSPLGGVDFSSMADVLTGKLYQVIDNKSGNKRFSE